MNFKKYNLFFRTVEMQDAEFIYTLRTNKALSQYLNKVSGNLEDQKKWITAYKQREMSGEEYYFVSYNADGEKFGLNRIYNLLNNSFEIGSWIYKKTADDAIPILGDLAVRDFGFNLLNRKFSFCTFKVSKNNLKVLKYHKMFGPVLIKEDDEEYHFKLSGENFEKQKNRLLKILNDGKSS